MNRKNGAPERPVDIGYDADSFDVMGSLERVRDQPAGIIATILAVVVFIIISPISIIIVRKARQKRNQS